MGATYTIVDLRSDPKLICRAGRVLGEILFVGLYEQTLDQPYGDGVGTGAEIQQMCKCVRGTHVAPMGPPRDSGCPWEQDPGQYS